MIHVLKMNMEFRKGLLFIRLEGTLTMENSSILETCLNYLIQEKGVKYFVINLKNLDYLDQEGIKVLQQKYQDMILHDGNLVICGYKNIYMKEMIREEMKNFSQADNELAAFHMIQI